MRAMARELVRLARRVAAADEVVATNHSGWRWEYDSIDVDAAVSADAKGNLRLEVTETRTKTGLGKGRWSTVLEDVGLGTVFAPRLGAVPGLLKKYGQEKSRAGWTFKRMWKDARGEDRPLAEIVAIKARAMRPGTEPEPGRKADPKERRELLMEFVRSMTPEEVEKAFAAVVGN
jgi:hypothetical protein